MGKVSVKETTRSLETSPASASANSRTAPVTAEEKKKRGKEEVRQVVRNRERSRIPNVLLGSFSLVPQVEVVKRVAHGSNISWFPSDALQLLQLADAN